MKQQQVSVKFSTPRYRALCYYLEKEGKNIEGELQKKLEEMYRDQVPKDVQEYVKAQNPGEDMDDDQNADPKSGKRQSAKQKADAPEATLKASGPVLSM